MCGIVGVGCFDAQGIWLSQEQMFRQLLIADSLRGIDGAGIVRVTRDGNADWRKIHGSGFDLLRANKVDSWLSSSISECDRILVGHNRFASVGKKITNNAHPFQHGNIVLVHNGFIANLSEFGKKPKQFEVDSEGLTFAISKHGILEVVKKLKGAYSIVYFDEQEKTLNFCRNYDRPLFYSLNETKKKLIFGSEKPMLEWIIQRTNNGTDYPEIKDLPVHTLMTISFEGEMNQTAYTPPPAYVYQTTPQWKEDEAISWEMDPDTHVWTRSTDFTNKPKPPVVYNPSPHVSPAHASWTNPTSNVNSKAMEFPSVLFGFHVGDKIQFVAMESTRTSAKQEQYRIVGSHTVYDKLEIRFWVKGKDMADTFIKKAVMVEGTVRALHRELNGTPVIFIIDPVPLFEPPTLPESTTPPLLLLPNNQTTH